MDLFKEFYSAYYDHMKEYFLHHFEGSVDIASSNYINIISRPANYESELAKLQTSTGIKFPQRFVDFYGSFETLEVLQIPFTGIDLATACVDQQGRVSNRIQNGFIPPELGLIPFGTYQDEWEICLDTSDLSNPDNPPIRLFELSSRTAGEKAVSTKTWFSSFDKFIMCLTDHLKTGDSGNFMKIDPANHFTTAYSYWNTEGS